MVRETRKNGIAARITAVLAAAALVAALGIGWQAAQASTAEQGAASLRQAILDAAAQCAAVEGAYPLSLSHLEECYGLSVNRETYAVTYEAFATNMPPHVVVKLR